MKEIEYEILSLYKKAPNQTFSTTEIVKTVQPKQYDEIEKTLQDQLSSKEKLKQAKRKKAQLHRKVLYHMNKLVENKILNIAKSGEKGEKYFALALEEGEEISVDKYKKKPITITKPQTPAMPIEGYESGGIVTKFEEVTWIDRLNCIIFEAGTIKDMEKTINMIIQSFSTVNDNIGINNFEALAQQNTVEETIKQLDRLEAECKDFAKNITLIIEISEIGRTEIIQELMKEFAEKKYEHINTVLNLEAKELTKYSSMLTQVIKDFLENGTKLYIKNNTVAKSPYSIGKEGAYCFNEDEWELYLSKVKGSVNCISLAQTTLSADIEKFYNKFGLTADDFDKFMINCAESLLSANSIQRKKAPEYFNYLIELNKPKMREAFMFSRNYIRLLNYEYLKQKFDETFHITLFRRAKERIDEFCHSEETIYKSCGMPTRFKICFSSQRSEPIEIKKIEELYKKDFKNKMKEIEELNHIITGGIITEFIKQRNIQAEDVIQEITTMLNTYKIPLICYTFKKPKGAEVKLSEYI